eukprot:929687-Prorocentrum_minimum.AAC.2
MSAARLVWSEALSKRRRRRLFSVWRKTRLARASSALRPTSDRLASTRGPEETSGECMSALSCCQREGSVGGDEGISSLSTQVCKSCSSCSSCSSICTTDSSRRAARGEGTDGTGSLQEDTMHSTGMEVRGCFEDSHTRTSMPPRCNSRVSLDFALSVAEHSHTPNLMSISRRREKGKV